MTEFDDDIEWYLPHEVAALFHVGQKTVLRWVRNGIMEKHNIRVVLTPGKHHRYNKSDVDRAYQKLAND